MTSYTRTGKQILLDGKHMADAVDDTAAMMILNALQAMEQRVVGSPTLVDAVAYGFDRARQPDQTVYVSMRDGEIISRCIPTRQGDEYACSCGLRWSVGEDDPHHTS